MYILTKKFRFEASHQLLKHDGKCKRLHGHSWQGEIEVAGEKIHRSGAKQHMLIDYAELSRITKTLVDTYLDHYHLNDRLITSSPTSEFVARWIYDRVVRSLPKGIRLVAVTIEETCTSRCRYEP